jgi:predicted RNA-binding Zn ribbon-like protein
MKNPALELMNSYHMRGSLGRVDDLLDEEKWRRAFTARWEMPELSDSEVSKLRRLRSQLRDMSGELTDTGAISAVNLALLNDATSSVHGRRLLNRNTRGKLSLDFAPARAMAASQLVITSFQELVLGKGEAKLRLCANPSCRWAFYDLSRNRSRKWCDSQECGNVMKARAFRARHKALPKRKA